MVTSWVVNAFQRNAPSFCCRNFRKKEQNAKDFSQRFQASFWWAFYKQTLKGQPSEYQLKITKALGNFPYDRKACNGEVFAFLCQRIHFPSYIRPTIENRRSSTVTTSWFYRNVFIITCYIISLYLFYLFPYISHNSFGQMIKFSISHENL